MKITLQNGLKEDIALGYWNRILPDSSYAEAVKTATEAEQVATEKKSITNLQFSMVAAISNEQDTLAEKKKNIEKLLNNVSFSS